MLHDALESVRQRIRQACQRSGRDPASVTLVCVTKGIPHEVVRTAVSCGVAELGENRVQEARAKHAVLQAAGLRRPIRWHLVGHLQRNKAKHAVELFSTIHSVDSIDLAEELERQASKQDRTIEVFLQVNVSAEATKYGCDPEATAGLARKLVQLPSLQLRGLMTLAPFVEDPEHTRRYFRDLRGLRDGLQQQVSAGPLQLSMGMSQDFEVAIEEGADVVRIGTAIFKGN